MFANSERHLWRADERFEGDQFVRARCLQETERKGQQ
jgi:hypothetical protein